MDRIILASQSPRRRELLMQIGIDFTTRSTHVEEIFDEQLPLHEQIMQVALSKAQPIAKALPNDCVVGADTIVVVDGRKIGKPKDEEDAKHVLSLLSNRTHQVYTGVAICYMGKEHLFYERTDVTFYELSDLEIEEYIETGEWRDKAGSYAIQGIGAKFTKKINGDYNNVIGLPVARLLQILKNFHNV